MGGISTTRAGTLLKHQIPIRTIQEWKETQPGFLEADLVAHCGMDSEGGHVYTLVVVSSVRLRSTFTLCCRILAQKLA
jgi:hypothetical protein